MLNSHRAARLESSCVPREMFVPTNGTGWGGEVGGDKCGNVEMPRCCCHPPALPARAEHCGLLTIRPHTARIWVEITTRWLHGGSLPFLTVAGLKQEHETTLLRITQAIRLNSGPGDALLDLGEKRELTTHGDHERTQLEQLNSAAWGNHAEVTRFGVCPSKIWLHLHPCRGSRHERAHSGC